ncbi:MAG TPA: ORF6N domain-containing protein [Phycisphaerae bacterium]|nr:ORF6N domain-containing protein [Phycisphaerae bacterium]
MSQIEESIFLVRGQKVMLDADLAALYGVTTKRLNEQVKRNRGRFPDDFIFRLSWEEIKALRSQIATLNTPALDSSRPQIATLKRGKNILVSIQKQNESDARVPARRDRAAVRPGRRRHSAGARPPRYSLRRRTGVRTLTEGECS